MLTRARSALPGMAVAVLLASPAFTAYAAEPPVPAARKPVADARKIEPRKTTRVTRLTPVAARAPQAAPILSDRDLEAIVWRQSGIASWYGGKRWQGKQTASGARYDERQLTAAHATLPIGTKVRVTLEGTDRSVIVVINDRPGTRTRIIDLSRQAAADLGILTQGIAVVSLTAL